MRGTKGLESMAAPRFRRFAGGNGLRDCTALVEQPHDRLFRLVFADPEHAVPLLRSALPAAIAETIDWRTLTRCPPLQHGRKGKQTICDLLFSARLGSGAGLLLYVVLEHKSKSTRFDALQMLEQVTAVLRSHRRAHPDEPFLPPVLPIVVHADQRPWASPLQLRALFDLDHIPAGLHRYLPALEYALDDLHQQDPERLRHRALTVFGLCTLASLQFLPLARRDEATFAAWVDAWLDVQQQAARLADTVTGRELFDAMVEYVLATSDLPYPVWSRVLIRRLTGSPMKKFVSTLQQLRNEGRAEGKAEGRIELLLRLIGHRFGAEAARSAEPRLRAAGIDELDGIAAKVLDARTFDDVFTD